MNLTLLSLMLLASITAQATDVINTIKIKKEVEVVNDDTFSPESVSVSHDGTKICWISKQKDSKFSAPSEIMLKTLDQEEVVSISRGGALNAFTKCTFDQDNTIVASKLHWRLGAFVRTIGTGLLKGDFDPIGYATSISSFGHDQMVSKTIYPKHLGHKSDRTFLKHPHISPNGEWLTYYLDNKGLTGVVVMHRSSGKTHLLGLDHDKHPTWTPDGKKIMFHHQIDQVREKPEMAYIGYFDLDLSHDGELRSVKRYLLDEPLDGVFNYHKHPTMLAGTNMIFFHGEERPGGKKKLFVRRLLRDSPLHEVKIETDEINVTKIKHPAIGFKDKHLYFIGKMKDDENDKVMRLNSKALEKIIKEVEAR